MEILTEKVMRADLNVWQLKLLIAIENGRDSRGIFKKKNSELQEMFKKAGHPVGERAIQKMLEQLKDEELITIKLDRRKQERYIRLSYSKKNKCFEYAEMSPAQKKFQDAFPSRTVNVEVPENVDMDKLISKIQNSKYLTRYELTSLRWYIEHYEEIMSGTYDNDKFKKSSFSTARDYTKEECNSLFQSIDEIEI